MSKVRTDEQPVPEHSRAAEFQTKIEPHGNVAQVHAKTVKHSYETALNVQADNHEAGNDARGTKVGAPDQSESPEK